jgi:hypothetical protein
MTIEDNAFEQASWELAQAVEGFAEDIDKAIVVKACCWVLADCIVAASRRGPTSIDEGIQLCMKTLIFCTAELAALKEPGTIQ